MRGGSHLTSHSPPLPSLPVQIIKELFDTFFRCSLVLQLYLLYLYTLFTAFIAMVEKIITYALGEHDQLRIGERQTTSAALPLDWSVDCDKASAIWVW